MRWFGPESLYYKVLFTWGQWVMPVPVAVMVTGYPPLAHLVILTMLSLALPSYIAKRRAGELWAQANHERWLDERAEVERRHREESMALLAEVRSCVARQYWWGAYAQIHKMKDDEIREVAGRYVVDVATSMGVVLEQVCAVCGVRPLMAWEDVEVGGEVYKITHRVCGPHCERQWHKGGVLTPQQLEELRLKNKELEHL